MDKQEKAWPEAIAEVFTQRLPESALPPEVETLNEASFEEVKPKTPLMVHVSPNLVKARESVALVVRNPVSKGDQLILLAAEVRMLGPSKLVYSRDAPKDVNDKGDRVSAWLETEGVVQVRLVDYNAYNWNTDTYGLTEWVTITDETFELYGIEEFQMGCGSDLEERVW